MIWDWFKLKPDPPPRDLLPDHPAYLVEKHLAYVQQLHKEYFYNTSEICLYFTKVRVEDLLPKPSKLRDLVTKAIYDILYDEDIFITHCPTIKLASTLNYYQEQLTTNHDEAIEFVIAFFKIFLEDAPDLADELPLGSIRVPLYDAMDPRNLINTAIIEVGQKLPAFGRRLMNNVRITSGHAPDTLGLERKHLIFPNDFKGSNREMVETYLAGTPLKDLFSLPVSFSIEDNLRPEHQLIVSGSGGGKTMLIQHDIFTLLQRPDPPAMVIIDSQGKMLRKIERLKCFATHLKDRIIILDPEFDDPELNMFKMPERLGTYSQRMREQIEASSIETMELVFAGLGQELTGRQTSSYRYLTRLMFLMSADGAEELGGGNIRTLLQLLRDPKSFDTSPFKKYILMLDQDSIDWFKYRFFSPKMMSTRDGVADRLGGIMAIQSFARMFGATANKVDWFTELNRGAIILCNTSKTMLGPGGSSLFGRYAVAATIRAMFERATMRDEDMRLVILYIDETKDYNADSALVELLTETRKYKLGACLAFQEVGQMRELKASAFSNTSIKIAGSGLSYPDARTLAPEMRTTPEQLMALKKKENEWGEFSCYLRNRTDQALTLIIPFGTIEDHAEKMTEEEFTEMRARNKRRVETNEPPHKSGSLGSSDPPSEKDDDETIVPPPPKPATGRKWK